ncbi:MAG: flagellar hook-basal body complex protein [Rhodocyclaceae bacterium]
MLDSIYVGFSGLTTFSAGLRTISNNVANLNTTGYKGNSLQFSDLYYKMEMSVNGESAEQFYGQGTGVGIRSERVNFLQGELRQTGQDTDLAVSGKGMFILRQDGKTLYTRNGNFEFSSDGYLVDANSGARVAGLTDANTLTDINLNGLMVSRAKATTEVKLTGNLYYTGSSTTDPGTFTLSDVPLYDASGGKTLAKLQFVKNSDPTTRAWNVTVSTDAGVVLSGGEIRFAGDGSPLAGFNTLSFSYTPTGGTAQTVLLNFGDAGTMSGVAFFSSAAASTSTVKQASQDGYGLGSLQKTTFDSTGTLTLTYTNGQVAKGARVALAAFDDMDALTRLDGARFMNDSGMAPIIRGAGVDAFGSIAGGKLEASNVDLAKEFSELIIIQRGYQTSSQIVQAANEMAQQVLDVVKRK